MVTPTQKVNVSSFFEYSSDSAPDTDRDDDPASASSTVTSPDSVGDAYPASDSVSTAYRVNGHARVDDNDSASTSYIHADSSFTDSSLTGAAPTATSERDAVPDDTSPIWDEYRSYLDQTSSASYGTPQRPASTSGGAPGDPDVLGRGTIFNPSWTGPQAQSAARQWSGIMGLVQRGADDDRPEIRQLSARLARDATAQQMAFLTEAVHDHSSNPTPPIGWNDISNDASKLERFGLSPADLKLPGSGLGARMFEPDPAIFGNDLRPTLAFERTDLPSAKDWRNNIAQATNGPTNSPQYERAVQIGNKLREHGSADQLFIAGHSLGGGLAAAAGSASGALTYTFGSAGLNPNTVTRYGGVPQAQQTYSYRVDGDLLIDLQDRYAFLPKDVGTRIELPATSVTPVFRHFIDDYWSGLSRVVGQERMRLDLSLRGGPQA